MELKVWTTDVADPDMMRDATVISDSERKVQ